MSILDNVETPDQILVSIETTPKDPVYPCPKCGSETKLHGEPELHNTEERICSSDLCRTIQSGIKEELKMINGRVTRFACRTCGHETKIYKDGKKHLVETRICSNPNCLNIIKNN